MGKYTLQQPVALTCPECSGAMTETMVGALPDFTCHIGHRFTAMDLEAAQLRALEHAMEVTLKTLNERGDLCHRMAKRMQDHGRMDAAERWGKARYQTRQRAKLVQQLLGQEWVRPAAENGGQGDDAPVQNI